ncbi:heavy-metal-associated domain-containing protein [Pseudostreptobacillus hongkongensis]|uniref:heavy-metal-associated domain-containing protein n=1 Tax=Pseudostreptobacillus hongkongensis TaxID=1162717 RepID=UPI0028D7277D|nr:heavy-metal-associated domain-containing protein [Pseudostreptobacillus hongkongensis]
MKLNLKINGMACSHCINSVKEELSEMDSLKVLDVKLGEAEIEISDESNIEDILEKVNLKLDDIGYELVR